MKIEERKQLVEHLEARAKAYDSEMFEAGHLIGVDWAANASLKQLEEFDTMRNEADGIDPFWQHDEFRKVFAESQNGVGYRLDCADLGMEVRAFAEGFATAALEAWDQTHTPA